MNQGNLIQVRVKLMSVSFDANNVMMIIAFITFKSSLVPLLEGL